MCPACESKRLHGPAEWEHHPYRTHGFNGNVWTHPDLLPRDVADAGAATSQRQISGEVVEVEAAPAGGKA